MEGVRRDVYGRLIKVVGSSLRQARKLRKLLGEEAAGLRENLEHFGGLVGRVVSQARKRVLDG